MIPIYFLTPNKLYTFMAILLYIYKISHFIGMVGQIKVKKMVNYQCD